jgi:hypothetical protein
LEAADVKNADKAAARSVALGIQHSRKNHNGKGVQRVAGRSGEMTLGDQLRRL